MKRGRRVNRYLFYVFLCLLLSVSGLVRVFAEEGKNDEKTLVVGVPADRCPIFYLDGEMKEPVGIGVDLMREAAAAAGYEASFRVIEEETLKKALDKENYDVLMPFGSAIFSASGQPSIVTDNLMQTPFTFVTQEGSSLPPMEELRVGMLSSLGGGIETLRQLYPKIEILEFESMEACVNALRKGEVDALLHNSYVWSYVLQKPAYQNLRVQPLTAFSMDFRAGTLDTPKGRSVVKRLNEGIASISDTRRQAIILDYTSRKLYRYDFFDFIYQYTLPLVLGILLFNALIIIGVQRMRSIRKEQERKLRQMMDYDPMTGILNINGFRKRVEELLRAHQDYPYILSYSNIRDFKYINDSLGRNSGDQLLRFWARKTQEALTDEEVVGRVTGDRLVLLRHLRGEEQFTLDRKKVIEPVENFFTARGKENRIQISSGLYVLTPEDYKNIDVDRMLDMARVAEERARENRSGNYEVYNSEQWEKGKRVADVINDLPKAIRKGEIEVWYQPQVNYATGEITGAEALCRWNHGRLGLLQPGSFIPTLEEAGLIYDLDSYVWERVCQDLKRWKEQGHKRFVSVNVSRGDIREDRDIPGQFRGLIEKYGLSEDQLRVEITETAYAESPKLLISETERLRSFGFQVEMDDFGSGFSSLHMLKEVPVDRIKLDLYFLTASGDPEKGRIIVSCVIQMVQMLGLELIAEGVENAGQAEFLCSRGSQDMQGYFFYRPMPVRDYEEVLAARESKIPDRQ